MGSVYLEAATKEKVYICAPCPELGDLTEHIHKDLYEPRRSGQRCMVQFDVPADIANSNNAMSMDDIKDCILSKKTSTRYIWGLFQILTYCCNAPNQPWTDF